MDQFQLNPPRRFRELDSLRGLAAITVVFDHFARICPPQIIHVLDRTPLRLLIAGHQAVILFFLLSGFVLTLPYKKNGRLNYGRFLLKRACRIYPPYLGALTFAIICDGYFSGRAHPGNYWINLTWSAPVTTRLVIQHILFVGNYDWSQFNTAFWSLVYQMRISLVLPLIAFAVLRLNTAWVILCAIALSLAFFPLAILLSSILHLCSRDTAINNMLTLHYAAFFIIGSFLAKEFHTINNWYARLTARQAAAAAVISLVLYSFSNASTIVQRFSVVSDLYDWGTAAGAIMIIVFAMNSRPFQGFLTSRTINHFGRISYSLYLIHGTILFVLINTLLGRVPMGILLLIYLSTTLLVTEIFHGLVERPIILLALGRGNSIEIPHSGGTPSESFRAG